MSKLESDTLAGYIVTKYDFERTTEAVFQKKADKFVSCPRQNASIEQRIDRNVNGTRNRMIAGIRQQTVISNTLNGTPITVFTTSVYATNERRSGFTWIATFPDWNIRTTRSFAVDRTAIALNGFNVTATHQSGGLSTDSDFFQNLYGIDQFTIFADQLEVGPNPPATNILVNYSLEGGRARWRWLNRDTGMDIEVGCN